MDSFLGFWDTLTCNGDNLGLTTSVLESGQALSRIKMGARDIRGKCFTLKIGSSIIVSGLQGRCRVNWESKFKFVVLSILHLEILHPALRAPWNSPSSPPARTWVAID